MKYDYAVKVNGKWYRRGEEIPTEREQEAAENDEGAGGKSKARNTNK